MPEIAFSQSILMRGTMCHTRVYNNANKTISASPNTMDVGVTNDTVLDSETGRYP